MIRPLVTSLPLRSGKNMLLEHLTLLEPLGIVTQDTKRRLGYSKESEKVALQFFKENGIDPKKDFVPVIFPSAGNKAKNWVPERFAEVAEHLQEKYKGKVVIIGGPADEEEVNAVIAVLKPTVQLINASNRFNLEELKAFLAQTSMFISVDAGPMHIAVAFGVPNVDILGPAPDWVAPHGEFSRSLSNRGDAEPAMHPLRNREFDYKEARRQAEAITVEQVISEIDALYNDSASLRINKEAI